MGSFVYFLLVIAVAQSHSINKYNNIEKELQKQIQQEDYRNDFKNVHYRLNKIGDVLEKVLKNIQGDEETVGYPTTLEEALELANVENKENQYIRTTYKSHQLVKLADEVEGEIVLPKGSSILTVKHQDTQKYWNLMKKSDVVIHYHYGSPVVVYTYNQEGEVKETLVGNPFKYSEAEFSVVIPQETFFVVDVLDKTPESYSVLSYSFFPGFVSKYHLKFPVEETEETLYKPTYSVRKYFGLEDVEPVMKNYYEGYFKGQFNQFPSEYRTFTGYSRRPRNIQEYLRQSEKYSQYKKVQGLVHELIKMNMFPSEVQVQLENGKVHGLVKYLMEINAIPKEILRQISTGSFYGMETSDLPKDIKEYLYNKYQFNSQDLKKYYEDIPSYVREYFMNIPREIKDYYLQKEQEIPSYLEKLPFSIRKYFENTPEDVQEYFQHQHYQTLPRYLRKYYQIMPQVVRRYFETVPHKYSQEKMSLYQDLPRSIHQYLREIPQEITQLLSRSDVQTPFYLRKYFGQSQDSNEFFGKRNTYDFVPKTMKNYFQNKQGQYFYNRY